MKNVSKIAELISRGLEKDEAAQEAVVEIMQKAEKDPELQEYVKDAAARVKEGRLQRDQERDTPSIRQEVDSEMQGGPSERERKLVQMLAEARMKIKELTGGEESLPARAQGQQNARGPQAQRSPQARPLQG